MTCIVGIENKGVVYIGADSAISDDNAIMTFSGAEKVFLLNNTFLIGACGSVRMTQILKYALKVPAKKSLDVDDMSYLVIDFIDAVRKILKDKASLDKSEIVESLPDSSFLLGYNKKLYVVDEDLQVSRCDDGYASVGSGDAVALGSLYTSKGSELSPEDRINTALHAAAHHTIHVRPKFHILTLSSQIKEDE